MNLKFKGLKKTDENFMKKIEKISADIESVRENLKKLDIFSSIFIKKNTASVVERKNKISVTSSGKNSNSLSINLPNLLGKGENIYMNISSKNEYSINLSRPVFLSKILCFIKLSTKKYVKTLIGGKQFVDKKEFAMGDTNFDTGIGFSSGNDKMNTDSQKYIFIRYKTSQLNFDMEKGLFNNIGTRIKLAFTKQFLSIYSFKYKMSTKVGVIFGEIPFYEKIEFDKKHKKLENQGIWTYNLETKNTLIYPLKNMDIYAYHNLNVSGNLKKYRTKNYCGSGLSIPLYDIDGPKFDISISVPLDKYNKLNNYNFSFDITF